MGNSSYLVTVSKTDIDLGLQCDPERCPVSLAIWRAVGPALVASDMVVMGRKGKGRKWELPLGVRRRISRYDNTGKMTPFTFELFGTQGI